MKLPHLQKFWFIWICQRYPDVIVQARLSLCAQVFDRSRPDSAETRYPYIVLVLLPWLNGRRRNFQTSTGDLSCCSLSLLRFTTAHWQLFTSRRHATFGHRYGLISDLTFEQLHTTAEFHSSCLLMSFGCPLPFKWYLILTCLKFPVLKCWEISGSWL
jgi:hypothetical protein